MAISTQIRKTISICVIRNRVKFYKRKFLSLPELIFLRLCDSLLASLTLYVLNVPLSLYTTQNRFVVIFDTKEHLT